MRKNFFIMLLTIFTLFIFTACGSNQVDPKGNGAPNEEETPNEEPVDSEEPAEEVFSPIDWFETSITVEPLENEATITISIKNTSTKARKITFNSGQRIDYVVKNEADKEVYSYSIDKSFTQAIEEMEIAAGDAKEWKENWNYTTNTGERLPAGKYKIIASVTASEINGQSLKPNTLQTEVTTFDIPAGNNAFRNVKVLGEDGEYVITGEARVFEASFFYAVEDGHDYLVKETVVMADQGAPEWGAFEIRITIPKDKLPSNGALILTLYERSAKDGSIINTFNTQLQHFN